jgi:DNA-binding transcriptional LysR family regulator
MNLDYLRYFVTLAKVKHYTKAAKQLWITQPSLSHAIAQLEEELGVPLFEKNGRRNTLTCFGEEFLPYAEQTIALLEEGMSSIQSGAQGNGRIRLGFLRTLGIDYLPRLTSGFLKHFPENEIRFTFHTDVTARLLEGLKQRNFDLLFCSKPPEELGFTVIPVKKQKLVLITPHDHPLASRTSVDLMETLSYPYVYFDKSSGLRADVDQMFAKLSQKPHIAYETEEDQVIAGFVAQGFGIAVVPEMDLLHRLDVSILEIKAPVHERDVCLVYDSSVYQPPVVQRFLSYVLEHQEL